MHHYTRIEVYIFLKRIIDQLKRYMMHSTCSRDTFFNCTQMSFPLVNTCGQSLHCLYVFFVMLMISLCPNLIYIVVVGEIFSFKNITKYLQCHNMSCSERFLHPEIILIHDRRLFF